MPRLVRDRITWLLYAQLAVYSYFLYGLGPVVPLLRADLDTSRTLAGLHGTAMASGILLSAAFTPWLVRRLGRRVTLWCALGGLAVGVTGLCVGWSTAATLSAVLVTGASGTVTISCVTAALSDHHGLAGPAAITEANGMAVLAGFAAPLVIGGAVRAGLGWRPAVAVAVVLVAVVAAAAFAGRVRVPDAAPVDPAVGGRLPARYWLVWATLIATAGVEFCTSLWASDQLRERAGMTPGAAAAAVSALVGGIAAGRLVGGWLMRRFSVVPMLLGAIGVAAGGFVLFWLSTVPWLAVAGLLVAGLGMALHYPLVVTLAIAASRGRPDLAASRLGYAVGIASGAGPFALGALADRMDTHAAFALVPVLLTVSLGAALLIRHVMAGQPTHPGPGREPVVATAEY